MLLDYGIGIQPKDWHVLETKPPMFARVYFVFGGNTVYHSGEMTRQLQRGWLYIFPAHAPYEMSTDPENPLSCMFLHLDLRTADLSHLIQVHVSEDLELTHLLQAVRDGVERQYPASYLELLIQSFESLCRIKGIFRTVDPEAVRLIDRMQNTYRTDTSVKEIAASMGYSTEYFIRLFRKKLGVTPHQYAVSLRMSDAVRMLATSASLDEIAAATGYTDGHSFANSFRRYYGISPGEYKKHYAGYI